MKKLAATSASLPTSPIVAKSLRIKSGVRAGGQKSNHNETLLAAR